MACRAALTAGIAVLAVGCGPMLLPMTPRMSDQSQRMIDSAWNNMLTPVGRVDRQTLLDTMMTYWMHQYGVDRLHLVSEKSLLHGKAIMEIDCDSGSPQTDQFTVTVLDERGRTVRRERYSRSDIEQSAEMLWDVTDLSPDTLRHCRRALPRTGDSARLATRPHKGKPHGATPSTRARATSESS